jgi:hypothetical protein
MQHLYFTCPPATGQSLAPIRASPPLSGNILHSMEIAPTSRSRTSISAEKRRTSAEIACCCSSMEAHDLGREILFSAERSGFCCSEGAQGFSPAKREQIQRGFSPGPFHVIAPPYQTQTHLKINPKNLAYSTHPKLRPATHHIHHAIHHKLTSKKPQIFLLKSHKPL